MGVFLEDVIDGHSYFVQSRRFIDLTREVGKAIQGG